ncbi:T9SS type B sorting domain-containing protein [Portibacter lacus]|uniref:Gliding motility-associated C-terminal domain-containing protein n=1 Tax=Portibacter lacus TaxID=1099794 RepID=A0AA37SUZ4_9BACT|nr:gliding motility-associated C-terminal domain-containing protein [Portibacter lacus]GLR18425.1 hypothetical protein GCM10007940_30410 [Portibacter lacus]
MIRKFIYVLGLSCVLSSLPIGSDSILLQNETLSNQTLRGIESDGNSENCEAETQTFTNQATANLSFDSYEFLLDCSILSITFCNTGSVAYDNSIFFTTLYDVNPLVDVAQQAYPFTIDLNEVIEPGECFETRLFKIDVVWEEEMLYGFINDNNTIPTPLDLVNYNPPSGFVEVDYLDNLFMMDFTVCDHPIVEICNNAIDDDGDGLTDAFDPECQCNNEAKSSENQVPNGDFEEHSGCCSEISQNASCVNDWEGIGGTADYYGVDCIIGSTITDIEEANVTNFDQSFISIGTSENFSETMGTCLLSPMHAGEEFKVSISASLPHDFLVNLTSAIELTVYGFTDLCPDFSSILGSSSNNFCSTTLSENAEKLITISSDDLLNMEFTVFESAFTPSKDINYIVLSIDCNDDNKGSAFFQIAEIGIYDMGKDSWYFDDTISVSSTCEKSIILSVPFSDTLNYQWYQDSMPWIGKESSSIVINNTNDHFSDFRVFVYNENGCKLVGPAIFETIVIPPTLVNASICAGSEYVLGDQILTSAGLYYETLESQLGCDSLIELTLEISNQIIENISRSICAGETFSFNQMELNQSGIYSDTISNSVGCDSIYILDLEVLEGSAYAFQDSFCAGESYPFSGEEILSPGVYSHTLSNDVGCDSIITLTLTEKAIPQMYFNKEICDGEEIKIGSQIYSESGNYSMMLKAENGCDTLLTLSLHVQEMIIGDTIIAQIREGESYHFNGEDFDEEGFYEMIIPSHSGCDSLVNLDLRINRDVYVPNVISTASTLGNDHLIVYSTSDLVIRNYRIFDRWGNIIFTSQNFRTSDGMDHFWNGHSDGQVTAKGVYIYYIEYEDVDANPKILTGSVTVI